MMMMFVWFVCGVEMMPSAVSTILDASHLDAGGATTFLDLGCGFGKFALQAFFQYLNLLRVTGVELCVSRYVRACKVLQQWIVKGGQPACTWEHVSPTVHRLHHGDRVLELRLEDMFSTPNPQDADIIICETGTSPHPPANISRL